MNTKLTLFLSKKLGLMVVSLVVVFTSVSQAQNRELPVDTSFVTTNQVTVKGVKVPYQVEAGTMPVYGKDNQPIASLFYTYYKRSDVKNDESRPIFISFNGGPGTGSLWMHLGYTSPVHLKISPEGYPIQPYGIEENPNSIIDVADIVYVNPVSTGFSRILNNADRELFFGVQADITYLADWISTFISRKQRWRSPKYLIGESYGTTRVAGLAGELQNRQWMHLNGVILVSGSGGTDSGTPVPGSVKQLPHFAATAWYHKQLAPQYQQRNQREFLSEVENFTIEEYLPALARGGFIDEARKKEIAKKIAGYIGLDEKLVYDYNLAVPSSAFWKELLKDEGYTVGRLDSRYKGIDKVNAGSSPDSNIELILWENAFTPAINYYLRDVLGFKTDLQYYVFGPVQPWNRGGGGAFGGGTNTGEMLRSALAENPALHLMYQVGYYDGAYFSSKFGMWNLDPSGKLRAQGRMSFKEYESGHMMYLRAKDIITANDDLRDFIKASTLEKDQIIGY